MQLPAVVACQSQNAGGLKKDTTLDAGEEGIALRTILVSDCEARPSRVAIHELRLHYGIKRPARI